MAWQVSHCSCIPHHGECGVHEVTAYQAGCLQSHLSRGQAPRPRTRGANHDHAILAIQRAPPRAHGRVPQRLIKGIRPRAAWRRDSPRDRSEKLQCARYKGAKKLCQVPHAILRVGTTGSPEANQLAALAPRLRGAFMSFSIRYFCAYQ
jgi:hypothetical protein